MSYRKLFNPKEVEQRPTTEATSSVGDRRDGSVYVYDDSVVLVVNVALATGRPLLVRGRSGCGKSSLARSVALVLGFRYYETVVSSRTQARDLLWEVDHLRRLHDAQRPGTDFTEDFTPYIRPGVLWWAFDRESAKRRGAPAVKAKQRGTSAKRRAPPEPVEPGGGSDHPRAVVLIDEIDKADPDVPNNLLVPLGSLQFEVEETRTVVRTQPEHAPLVFLSTNEERELPAAFLRRCVELEIPEPGKEWLTRVARAHFPKMDPQRLVQLADLVIEASRASSGNKARVPSTAEFLDTIRASIELEIGPDSAQWKSLTKITVGKPGRAREVAG